MPELSLNSFFGMQSTKEPPAAGLLKTGNSSLQGNQSNHGENSFLAKLADSMNNESTTEDQNSTLIPSELINILSNEEINYLIDLASMGTSTNIATNVSNDQMPLYQFLNHNIPVEALTNGITNNNINNGKVAPVQTQAKTLPGHALTGNPPGNQSSSALNEPNIELAKIAQGTTGGSQQELPPTSLIGKLNTSQISSKTNEQSETGIPGKLNPVKIADTTGDTPLPQSSKTPGKQIAESHKGSDTDHDNQNNQNIAKINKLNAAGVLNKLNPVKTGTTAGGEPPSQAATIPGTQVAESHKGANTNSNNQNNANGNNQNRANNTVKPDNAPTIDKASSEQTQQASKAQDSNTNSSTNSVSQNNPIFAQADSSESQKIFDIRPESVGAIVSKSSDNTTTPIINSGASSVNADEVLLPSNTSSNNSSFNNQTADTPNESYINAVTTSQKAEPGKDFTSTLSQINNSTKPLESLGRDTADNIVQKAKLFMDGGKSEVKIQLNPPELGTLKLEFEVEDDNLELKIKVERSGVKDVIEKDIPRLRDLLSNANVDVGKLDVSLQEKEEERLGQMDKDLQSDSENDNTKDLQDQDSESIEDSIEEESIEYDKDSNKINLLA
ncbi:MAG: hypothetical protein MAG551_01741 [Candidatus Scalindua arabica]|uniref:Flagellar hook-length control protein-like C-terminal domain-containing protein n=1 Tax=Candidatus Scalindua arabica TaxID=1127984 RepID=A0A941W358_9BACT|nr:hypothetical protein [Candidatus Scalindua arabica]